jgi:putative FmdB family regulatory protein
MPTYEYKCEACGFKFEKFQSIKSAAVKKCPHCGKSRVKRLIGTGGALIFKGGGFYTTDYRSDAYKTAAKADTADKPASTEAKPSESEVAAGKAPAAETPAKAAAEPKPAAESKSAAESKPAAKPAAPAKNAKSPK